ncbi:MAG: hypothetical protein E7367_00020 [Clostridiales bacterium]|nr:hypothetical protein [Clostridiales bacterium]
MVKFLREKKAFFAKALSVCLAISLSMTATACGGKTPDSSSNDSTGSGDSSVKQKIYDNETMPVTFSVGELDGVFNPFYSTSAYDGEIVGMTQISMLSSDALGGVAYGREEPVMTLDMTQTMYDADGQVTEDGSSDGTTVYEFLIKNGVKDSQGYPITINDVLFNMYVYLDPVYNGSSTMYSTKIQGLNAYKTGKETGTEDEVHGMNTTALANARSTINNVIAYANAVYLPDQYQHAFTDEQVAEFETYIEKLYGFFENMLPVDWNGCSNSMETAQENYILVDGEEYRTNKENPRTYEISKVWEYFCIAEGLCQYVKVNDDEKTDEETPRYYVVVDTGIQNDIEQATAGLSDADAILEAEKKICFDAMRDEYKNYGKVETLCYGFSVGNELLEYLKGIELEKLTSASDAIKNIHGITTRKTTVFNGVNYAESHDVLRIVINGVDPKAIWNFAFTVAPMRYYASAEQIELFDGLQHFGVEKSSTTYRDDQLKNVERMGLPIGGGAYMASSANGTPAKVRTDFRSKNVVYYQRNPYFYTIGIDSPTATKDDYAKSAEEADTPIHNAKIKYLRYQVVSSSNVMDAMIAKEIDFSSEISAKQATINQLNQYSDYLDYARQPNNGYGYIGLNAKYVPDIEVRRLIMYVMDRTMITDSYYTDGLGSIIERPMTTNSWAYPDDATQYYTQDWFIQHYQEAYGITLAKVADTAQFLENALKALGYQKSDGIYQKKLADGKTTSKLDYTFTIAGETKDHPAYSVFALAAEDLNKAGMSIDVKTDAQALSKLANGQLAVWAAAWGSAIDPDLYQVYHKYSQATSVNNWGYSTILDSNNSKLYEAELKIIDKLSKDIDLARATLDQDIRADIYAEALDYIMELAVELPTYQRVNLLVYNSSKIDPASLTAKSDLTAYRGLIEKIWELDLL